MNIFKKQAKENLEKLGIKEPKWVDRKDYKYYTYQIKNLEGHILEEGAIEYKKVKPEDKHYITGEVFLEDKYKKAKEKYDKELKEYLDELENETKKIIKKKLSNYRCDCDVDKVYKKFIDLLDIMGDNSIYYSGDDEYFEDDIFGFIIGCFKE